MGLQSFQRRGSSIQNADLFGDTIGGIALQSFQVEAPLIAECVIKALAPNAHRACQGVRRRALEAKFGTDLDCRQKSCVVIKLSRSRLSAIWHYGTFCQ